MQYLTNITEYHDHRETTLTIGKFDALHKGHERLLAKLQQNVDSHPGRRSLVLAFDMGGCQLLTNGERKERLQGRVDCLLEIPFTGQLAGMGPEEFLADILVKRFHMACIVVGEDFRFGRNRLGNVSMLSGLADRYHFQVQVEAKVRQTKQTISSSAIKKALEKGDLPLANDMLGYAYGVSGVVEPGKRLGRQLGFPTMNVPWPKRKALPRFGVYTCRVQVEGDWYPGVVNVGVKPTVHTVRRVLAEVYVFGYTKECYGQKIYIELHKFQRPEKKFASLEALQEQLQADLQVATQNHQKKITK